jgi:hypothetical protein
MLVKYCLNIVIQLGRLNPKHVDKSLLDTRTKSRDHEIVTAQKIVSKGCPNPPPKSCSVVTDSQVQCEVICDWALNQMLFQWISIHAGLHT